MKNIETELCAYSAKAVQIAAQIGVTRVELCASPGEGGVTPSAGTIAMARKVASGASQAVHGAKRRHLELSIMIRPRGGDFVYNDLEFETMKRDIVFARESGADGVVFGLLTAEGNVDIVRTRALVELARPMESTFHRAFDVAADWRRALEDIITTGCRRILTSGQHDSAPEGIEAIREIVHTSAGRIEIMAGAGVNPSNGFELAGTGVDALHFSARTSTSHGPRYADPGFIREMVSITRGCKQGRRIEI